MNKLVILRHGESIWNLENKFTGWVDVDLSKNGIKEAANAGELLKKKGFKFDIAYTSFLKRAIKTLDICMSNLKINPIQIKKDWRLNERHYGKLQGLNKKDTAKKFGEKQVLLWRRSFDVPPPAMREPTLFKNPDNNSSIVSPLSESLKDVVNRFKPMWINEVLNQIKLNKKILIVAHGNSLRALIMILKNLSETSIIDLNIPTGIPLVVELDNDNKHINDYYLGSKSFIEKKIQNVSKQGSIHSNLNKDFNKL